MEAFVQPGSLAHFPSIGRWSVTAIPGGWIYVADFGIRQMAMDATTMSASVCAGQDILDSENGLAEYIEKQKRQIENHLKEAKFAGPQTTTFADADEAQLLFVRHHAPSVGNILHAQTYVRLGTWIGIITFTASEMQLKAVRADYEAFVKGLRIGPQLASEPAARVHR